MVRSGKKAAEVIAMKRTTSDARTPGSMRGRDAESEVACPRRLPVVRIRGRLYFRDDRVQEFRSVDAPWDIVPFEVMRWARVILGKWPE